MEHMSASQLLYPAAGDHSHAQARSQSRKDMHDFRGSFPECFWQRGVGRVGRVSLSLRHSVSGIRPFFSGRFLERNTKVSVQGSSTKRNVVSAADFEIPPNGKGISEHNESFPHSLCDYQARAYLLLFVSAAVEQFQSHKEIAGPLFQSRPFETEGCSLVPDLKS